MPSTMMALEREEEGMGDQNSAAPLATKRLFTASMWTDSCLDQTGASSSSLCSLCCFVISSGPQVSLKVSLLDHRDLHFWALLTGWCLPVGSRWGQQILTPRSLHLKAACFPLLSALTLKTFESEAAHCSKQSC